MNLYLKLKLLLLFVSLVLLSLVLAYAPLFPNNAPIPGRDSGVFLYIGREMLNGAIPYRDIWDHKAPMIYVLNALGLFLGGLFLDYESRWGVFGLEVLHTIIAAFVLMRIVASVSSFPIGFLSIIFLFTGLSVTIDGGNLTEEYALLPQLISIWIITRLLRGASPATNGAFLATCFCYSFLLRPNLCSTSLLSFLFGLIFLHANRNKAKLWGISFITVLSAIFGSVLTYFWSCGALGDFWDQVFYYNSVYAQVSWTARINVAKFGLDLFQKSDLATLTVLPWIGVFIFCRKLFFQNSTYDRLLLFCLCDLLLAIFSASLSGREYGHYFMTVLPSFAILGALGVHQLLQIVPATYFKSVEVNAALLIAIFIGDSSVRDLGSRELLGQNTKNKLVPLVSFLEDNPNEVLIWGAETSAYVAAGTKAPTRFIYQYPFFTAGYQNGAMIAEFLEDLEKSKVNWIIDTSRGNPGVAPLDSYKRERWQKGLLPRRPGYQDFEGLEPFFAYVGANFEVTGSLGAQSWPIYHRKEYRPLDD